MGLGCWHFDKGATTKFDDVLTEHGGLPHDLSLDVHLKFHLGGQVEQRGLQGGSWEGLVKSIYYCHLILPEKIDCRVV